MKPKALKVGDTIGIAAPASPFERAHFEAGVKTLTHMGFKVFYRPDIFDKKRYLAGSDERRLRELTDLFSNPEIQAILFARGGYGLLRLLPLLDRQFNPGPPKIVLGYSDITPLLHYLHQKRGWVTFYGPVVAKDLSSGVSELTKKFLRDALTRTQPLGPFVFPETTSLKPGVCEGTMIGGCLSLVVATLGTPYEIQTEDGILFLEDTNEKPYAVDRMLTQLILAGKLKKVRGILFGNFVNGGEANHFRETIEDVLRDFSGPVLFNFPAGHGEIKVTLPLGIQVRLSAHEKKLEYLEGACESH